MQSEISGHCGRITNGSQTGGGTDIVRIDLYSGKFDEILVATDERVFTSHGICVCL